MDEWDENIRGIIQSASDASVPQIHEYGFHHHNLLDCTGPDYAVCQTFQKTHPPKADHVVCED